MKYGYARCSTNESKQDIQRQVKELKNQVLLASRDHQLTLLGQTAVVTRVEPAVLLQNLLGEVGALVVAQHNGVAAHADLAVAVLVDVVKLDLHAGERHADRTGIVHALHVYADKRRALGNTVAVVDVNADRLKEIGQLGTQGRAAANDLAEIAAKGLQHRAKERAALINADLAQSIGELDQPREKKGLALLTSFI